MLARFSSNWSVSLALALPPRYLPGLPFLRNSRELLQSLFLRLANTTRSSSSERPISQSSPNFALIRSAIGYSQLGASCAPVNFVQAGSLFARPQPRPLTSGSGGGDASGTQCIDFTIYREQDKTMLPTNGQLFWTRRQHDHEEEEEDLETGMSVTGNLESQGLNS